MNGAHHLTTEMRGNSCPVADDQGIAKPWSDPADAERRGPAALILRRIAKGHHHDNGGYARECSHEDSR